MTWWMLIGATLFIFFGGALAVSEVICRREARRPMRWADNNPKPGTLIRLGDKP